MDTDIRLPPILFWSWMIRGFNLWWGRMVYGRRWNESTRPPWRGPFPRPLARAAKRCFSTNGPNSIKCIGCHGSEQSQPRTWPDLLHLAMIGSTSRRAPAESLPADANLRPSRPHSLMHKQLRIRIGSSSGGDELDFANVRMLPAAAATYSVCRPSRWIRGVTSNLFGGGPSLFVTADQCGQLLTTYDDTPISTKMLYSQNPDQSTAGS